MKFNKSIFILIFIFAFCFLPVKNVFAGSLDITPTDSGESILTYFFDLRDRETFIQLTNISSAPAGHIVHIQIFNVDQECNENNFFDVYTPSDTHVYNMRDIETNDGNPSGVVLPENAYGFVVAGLVESVGGNFIGDDDLIGNFRVIGNSGYEYRTNAPTKGGPELDNSLFDTVTFNFNQKGDVTLSDLVFMVHTNSGPGEVEVDPLNNRVRMEVDIVDLDENIFSCINIASTCIDQNSIQQENVLEQINGLSEGFSTNLVNFEFGINNSIPSSKNAPLICPGNTINDGIILLDTFGAPSGEELFGFIGLNNGDGRGSMDSLWFPNEELESVAP